MRGEFKDTGGNAPSEGDGPFTGFEQGGEEGGDEEGGESLVKDQEVERDVSTRVTPKNIVEKLTPLLNLNSSHRKTMVLQLKKIKKKLGQPGVYERAASSIITKAFYNDRKKHIF